MTKREDIELKLGEFRARHTGKDPFGPWTDLKALHASLDAPGRVVLAEVLEAKRADPFWQEFIELFERDRRS
jgi:hypothetical protein